MIEIPNRLNELMKSYKFYQINNIFLAMKSPQLPQNPQKLQQKILKLQQRFRKACLSYQANPNYCQLYIQSFDNLQYSTIQQQYKKKTYFFADQINLFKKGESFYQRLQTILTERQQILRDLREELITNRNQKYVNITYCCQKLSHIRMYTLTIVQELQLLKKKLKINQSKYINQIYIKLIRDVDFLRLSPLRKHIEFSTLEDPFFLIPLKKTWDLELASNYHHKSVVELFTVDENYKKRLQNADKSMKNVTSHSEAKFIKKQKNKIQDNQREIPEQDKVKTTNDVNQNETAAKFFLPSINKQKYNSKQKTNKSGNSLQKIIKQYQTREKIKKKNDRYLQHANKKRAITHANHYQSQRDNSIPLQTPINMALKRSYSIDDDYNDQPDSTYFKSFTNKNKYQSLQSIKRQISQPQKQQNHLDSIQIHPFALNKEMEIMTKKEFQTQKDTNDNVIANKRRSKKIINKNQKLKETVYNNFALKNTDKEQSKQTKLKKQNPPIKHQEYRSQKLSNSSKIDSNLASIHEVDEQKPDKKYKNPLDLLIEVRYLKKQLEGNIIQYDEKNEKNQQSERDRNSSVHSSIGNITKQSKEKVINQGGGGVMQKLLQSMKKVQNLQIQTLNLNEKIQINLPKNTIQNNLSYSFAGKGSHSQNQKDPSIQKQSNQIQNLQNAQNSQVQNKKLSIKQSNAPAKPKKKRNNKPLTMHKQFQIQSNNSDKQSYAFETEVINKNDPIEQSQQEIKPDKKLTLQKQFQIHALLQQNKTIQQKRKSQIKRRPGQIEKQIYLQRQYSLQKKYIQSQKASYNSGVKISNGSPMQYNKRQNILQTNYSPRVKVDKSLNYQSIPQYQTYNNPYANAATYQEYNKNYYKNTSLTSQPQQIRFQVNPHKQKQQYQTPNLTNQSKKLQSKLTISLDEQSRDQPQIKQSSKMQYSKQQTKILKQCIFQSKPIQQQQLIKILSSLNSKSSQKLFDYTRKGSYFMNRQIIFSTCLYNNTTICYCITSPYLTLQSRYLFILHLEIVQSSFSKITTQIFSTFIKYIFFNDPTNKLIYLRLKHIFNQQYLDYFQMMKNYQGEIKTPIKNINFDEKSYLFVRKDIKCRVSQDYTSIFNTIALFFTNTHQEEEILSTKNKNLYFSSEYLKKIYTNFKQKQIKKFQDNEKLQKYLQQSHLPKLKQPKLTKNIFLYQQIYQDCLINIRYYSFSKYFYFTIQPPLTYFFSSQNIYYLFISTSFKNKYYVIADKIYQESENIDIYKDFKRNVVKKKITDLECQKNKGKIVACPQFKKSVQANITQNTSVVINFELNWKDYIKGTKYFRQEYIYVQLIGPFLCSFIEINQDKIINHLYSTIIQKSSIKKL